MSSRHFGLFGIFWVFKFLMLSKLNNLCQLMQFKARLKPLMGLCHIVRNLQTSAFRPYEMMLTISTYNL